MAVDRRRLVDALGFGQTPAYGFLPEGIWNYTPQSFPWRSLTDEARVAEAQRLYKAAGFTPDSPLKLRLLYNANPIIQQTAVIVADMWKKVLGVDVELTGEEYRVFLESRHDRSRWDVVRLSWNADYNDAGNFLEIFSRNSPNNDEAYKSPVVDDLLTAAQASADAVGRRELLQKAESAMLNDYPIIPLYFFVSKRLVKPYVLGLHPSPLNSAPSSTLRMLPANNTPQP
jgi:oligopeptide transport system substrate-binding protein